MDAAIRFVVAHAGARRARRRQRRRMAAALLYRRHRRAGARLHAGDQSRRRPAVDGRDGEALAQAGGLHRRRGEVREAGRARSRPRSPCPRRRCSASGCGTPSARRRPIRSATISCATAWRRCGARSRCCRTWASTSCRSTIRTSACSSIPTCARRYDDPDRAADFAVDMINATVDGLRRHQVRRPSLPPRRRARARREAPCRHLRADPAAAQPPEGPAPHDGVHRGRRRRPREPRPPARGFRARAWAWST